MSPEPRFAEEIIEFREMTVSDDLDRKVFVLVHGGWHGGWCWQRVSNRLQRNGHKIYAPTLSGLADRSHLKTEPIDLTTHIKDVVGLIEWEDLSKVTLVGHSYGGMVISGAAEHIADKVERIVFVDAFVPQDGFCTHDYYTEGRDRVAEMERSAGPPVWIPPKSAEAFNVNIEDRAWVDSKCTPHPHAAAIEKIRLTGKRDRIGQKVYIRAANYPSVVFDKFYQECERDPSWRTMKIAAGHDIMIDAPDELADALAG